MPRTHVDCDTFDGQYVRVRVEELEFRPSAYALIHREGRVLLIRLPNGKYYMPGGAVEKGETLVEAVIREAKEETGLDVEVRRYFCFREQFFYYRPTGSAWHGLSHCYVCEPLNAGLDLDPGAGDPEEGTPVWVDPRTMKDEEFHGIAAGVIREFLSAVGG